LPPAPTGGFLVECGKSCEERDDDDWIEVREKTSSLLSRSERFFLSLLSESLIFDCREIDEGVGD